MHIHAALCCARRHVPAEDTTMKTWSRSFTVVAAAAAALAIAACSNNDNNNPSGPKNDTTAPTVASVSAGDSHHISVMFSEPVDRTTAEEEANFTITETGPATPVTVMNAALRSD